MDSFCIRRECYALESALGAKTCCTPRYTIPNIEVLSTVERRLLPLLLAVYVLIISTNDVDTIFS